MNTWAVLAAKQAAIASGLGAGATPAFGAASLDGFAIGALISGACMLVITSPRRERRRTVTTAHDGHALAGMRRTSARTSEALGDAARELLVPEYQPDQDAPAQPDRRQAGARDYQSRHRLAGPSPSPKPETRRSAARHAAPPVSLSSRVTSLFGARAQLRAGA